MLKIYRYETDDLNETNIIIDIYNKQSKTNFIRGFCRQKFELDFKEMLLRNTILESLSLSLSMSLLFYT